jgi:hypothetical protein
MQWYALVKHFQIPDLQKVSENDVTRFSQQRQVRLALAFQHMPVVVNVYPHGVLVQ